MRALAFVVAVTASCAVRAPAPRVPDVALQGSDGGPHRLAEITRGARFTVVTFFSATCPCQRAHDVRLAALAKRYRDQGVTFVAVDSESSASPEADAAEAKARAYPYLLLSDPKGAVADALGGEYATHTVVLDASSRVRYRGAVDSDKRDLNDDADPYLADALAQLVAGRDAARPSTEALGCVLRR